MSDENYSKREIDQQFVDLKEHLGRQDGTLAKVLEQTTKTNGKVADLQGWRQYITGGLAVLTVLFIPILLFFIYQVFHASPKP